MDYDHEASLPGGGVSTGVLAKTRLKKAGGSLVVTVPAAARRLLNLSEGQQMAISVEGSKVVLEAISGEAPMRVRQPKYTLDELLAGTEEVAQLNDEERAWHDAEPVGRETW
jgi:antitoxin ChpS